MSISDNQARRAAGVRALALHPLVLVLALGLALRLLLWGALPRSGLISDEGEYLAAASWLAQGRGFSWYQGYLWTRAPLYPLFVAAHLAIFGGAEAALVTQAALSLLNVALTYALARRALPAAGRGPASLAALLMAVSLPFAAYPQMLLSETLFVTLMLAALLALAMDAPRRPGYLTQLWSPALGGALLGSAALTRSLALGFVPLAALWLWRTRSLAAAAALALAAAAIVMPWTIYNSRMYGGAVLVDTSGAFNLLLGARTAHDGRREDARVRDYVLGLLGQRPASDPAADACAPFPGPLPSQAARQQAMTAEGLCLIADRPGAFAQKSLAELIDLFQINYTGAERFTTGFTTGRLPAWYAIALFLLDDTLYVLALPLGVLGWAAARRGARDSAEHDADSDLSPRSAAHGRRSSRRAMTFSLQPSAFSLLVGLWWLYNLAVAPLLFAINRFRLPLLPFLFIYAAYALWLARGQIGRRPAAAPGARPWFALCGALAALLWLVAATPYAYLEPRAPGTDSRWASYLGPYPSSLAITGIVLDAAPKGAGDARFAAAMGAGDLDAAAEALRGPVSQEIARLGPALIAARQGRPEETLRLLPPPEQIADTGDARAATLRGDALRSLGDEAGARAAFTPRFVDDANPVAWAWDWLRPAPAARIDLGGNLDLGYISGCFLGEGDAVERATYRWCSDGAQLRFPGAATGEPQRLTLRLDGRGWAGYAAAPPPLRVIVGGQEVGALAPRPDAPAELSLDIPAAPRGSDVVVTLRTATFVPGPERYLLQQSEQSLGQVQRLGVRLDWAELAER